MSPAAPWVIFGPIAVVVSAIARSTREDGAADPLERWTLAAVLAGTYVSMAAVVLGLFGLFEPIALTLVCATLAAMLWPWTRRSERPRRPATTAGRIVLPLALGLGAVALRIPPAEYALAGRDQGTYTLRAHHLLRTGGFTHTDAPLAAAAADASRRSGPADVLGLYPKRSARWREDRYEAAYRPGWYLADQDTGHVVPQFFHLHPTIMAIGGMVAGTPGLSGTLLLQAFALVLVLFFIARRVLRSSGWASVAVLVVVAAPLAIWVHRTALSETPASLLVWSAVLAVLRCPDHDLRGLDRAGVLLGATGWVRGNAWLTAPVVLALLWLLPGRVPGRRRAVGVFGLVLAGGVMAHANSVFPYLADELNKQLHVAWLRNPWTLVVGALCAAVAWWSVDAIAFHGRHDGPRSRCARTLAPWTIAAVVIISAAAYLAMRVLSPPTTHARLDPAWAMFGAPVVVGALAAVPWAAHRARMTRVRDVWLAAIAASFAATMALYAQRNLPQGGLFYYGRYLVPELLPAAALLSTAVIARIAARLRGRLAAGWTIAAVGGLVWTLGLPLLQTPQVRLREFEGAQRLVDAIAEQVPPGAIVVAGGEGWHHGHTFNQVGGALAMRHGIDLLPYSSKEAFYATAYELLVSGPASASQRPPALYLLLGEATHHYRPVPSARPRAAVDDLLPPPFRVRAGTAFELFTDRLTPTPKAMPERITRDELRMVLMRVEVEASHLGERRWRFADGRPPGLVWEGEATLQPQGLCLHKNAELDLRLPVDLGPGSVVVVMTPGTSGANPKLEMELDGRATSLRRTRAALRPRDTLGPVWARSPARVTLRGLRRRHAGAACPFGGVAEVRWLEPDRPALGNPPALRATTFAPPRNLGHRVEPTEWVRGRGLSRYRPSLDPAARVAGLSIVLQPEAPLRFGPEPVPGGGTTSLDVVLTLTFSEVGASTRVVVFADGEEVAELDPPQRRRGTWQSTPVTWTPPAPLAQWSVELRGGGPEDVVHVRDIGMFSRGPAVPSARAPQSSARPTSGSSDHLNDFAENWTSSQCCPKVQICAR